MHRDFCAKKRMPPNTATKSFYLPEELLGSVRIGEPSATVASNNDRGELSENQLESAGDGTDAVKARVKNSIAFTVQQCF